MRHFLFLFVLCALYSSCDSKKSVELRDIECEPRPDDSTGYLEPICNYLVDTFGTYDVDPNTLDIERVESGADYGSAQDPYNTAQYDYVFLDCCYTGDGAVIDTNTLEVVEFWIGAV
jgi:hypothetical protein